MNISNVMQKRAAVILIILILAGTGIMIIKKKKAALMRTPPPAVEPAVVHAAFPEVGEFPVTGRYLGVVKAKNSVDIAPRITGEILEVRVRQGRHVVRGEILALLDARQIKDRILEFRARLAAARSAFQNRQGIYLRDLKLFKARAISREQLDNSRAARDAAKAEVAVLESTLQSEQTELSYSMLTAPFDGVITRRLQDPGDLALTGRPVLSMEQPSAGYYVEIKVPQAMFPLMKKGEKVFISMDWQGGAAGNSAHTQALHNRPARQEEIAISRIHPAIRSGTLAIVEADMDHRPFGLPTGSTVRTAIRTGTVKGVKVPLDALLQNVDSTFIFLADHENRVRIVKVDLLCTDRDSAVVGNLDLPEGSMVIIARESALLRLHQGDRVRIVTGRGER